MKNLFILLMMICVTVKAQDTIRFRNGESKAVKVSEVGLTNIHYSRFDNLDGPKYIVEKNDVRFIKYSGGQVDSFAVTKPQQSVATEKPQEQLKKKSGYECDKIIIQDKYLSCNGRPIGESGLLKLIPTVEDNAKKNRMLKAYSEMKTHKKKQYLIGFVCLGVGVGAAYFGFIGSVISEEVAPIMVGAGLGFGIGITGAVISSIHKHRRAEKKLEVARIYNE